MPSDLPSKLPIPGTTWTRGGATWWATAVTIRGVLLHSEHGEEITIPAWVWPEEFRPETAEEEKREVHRPHVALLIGGDAGKWFDLMYRAAENVGIEIRHHVSGRQRRLGTIPVDTEIIVLMTSHVGHPMAEQVRRTSKQEGIPRLDTHAQGFERHLVEGLKRLGLSVPEGYGGLHLSGIYWEWDGKAWHQHEVGEDTWDAPCDGYDTGLAGLLALTTIILAARG